jgi:hypothetical protein
MDEFKASAASNETGAEPVPVYRKPQLKRLGGVAELTKASTTFSNTTDSSNVLGSDYS